MPKMSKKEYQKTQGQLCPNCRGELLEFTDSVNDIGEFRETVECLSCLATFERIFKLECYRLKA